MDQNEEVQEGQQAEAAAVWEKFNRACEAGDVAIIKEIYQTGEIMPSQRWAIMPNAISTGSLMAVRCLAELGVNPSELSIRQLITCHSLDMFKLLAQLGVDFKADGNNILEDMIDNREILDWLLDQGVDINSNRTGAWKRVKKGETDNTCAVLNAAAAKGDVDLFEYLVSRGAKPSRSIALHTATKCKDPTKSVTMMTHLIEKYRMDPNADDTCNGLIDTMTPHLRDGPPLNWAIVANNIPAVALLLKHGADPRIGRTLTVTILAKHEYEFPTTPAIELLLEHDADATEGLVLAVAYDNLEAAEMCLKYGADPLPAEKEDAEAVGKAGYTYSPVYDDSPYGGMNFEMRNLINQWKNLDLHPI